MIADISSHGKVDSATEKIQKRWKGCVEEDIEKVENNTANRSEIWGKKIVEEVKIYN